MVRHIVTWSYRDGFTDKEKEEIARKIKAELEALPQSIGGIIEIKVHMNLLSSSNRDMVLNSLFESEEALSAYQIHPEHKKVSSYVRSVMQNRVCIDYDE